MTRFIVIWSLLMFLGCRQESISDDPNILIIVTDDQGYGDVGYNGNDVLETPVLDKLASRSIIFDRFYVSPVCAPTRASLLTGKYHLSTGVSWVTHRKEVMRQDEITLAEYLRDKGYATGLFGKWHNGNQFPHDPTGQGFESFIGFKEGHFNNYFDPKLYVGLEEQNFQGYLPDIITDEAIKFIEKARKPFFGMVTYNTPHSPFQVPDRYFDKYKNKDLDDRLASIYGMIENIDNNVGRLIDQLEATKKLDNTLIFFVGDNGPNGVRYNGELKGIKSHVDEGGVRVPALLSYPQKGWNTGKRIGKIAAHIDLLPTIASLHNDDDLMVDGLNLEDLIHGIESERTFFTHQVIRKFDRYPGAVREGDYLLTIKEGINELYNIKNDKSQLFNLSDSLSHITEELRTKYEKWIDKSIQELGKTELIETGHENIPEIVFQAQEVFSREKIAFKGKEGWSNDYFINFTDSSMIQWQTKTVVDARYQFSVKLNAGVGTKIFLQVDSVKHSIVIDQPFYKVIIPSPDRVERGEVYAFEWAELGICTIPLKSGIHTFRIWSKNPNNLQIKSLQLTKVDEQSIGTS